MALNRAVWSALGLAAGLLAASGAQAVTVWDESVNGDFANTGANATVVAVSAGANTILGATGNPGTGTDRDYFSITVPAGHELTGLWVDAGTVGLGARAQGFIGIQVGTQVTVSPTGNSAVGLLGQSHYEAADVGTDILPRIGAGAGASGFSGALGAGSYAFWVQDFNAGSSPYAFTLTLAPVPEPATVGLLAAGLAVLGLYRRRQAR